MDKMLILGEGRRRWLDADGSVASWSVFYELVMRANADGVVVDSATDIKSSSGIANHKTYQNSIAELIDAGLVTAFGGGRGFVRAYHIADLSADAGDVAALKGTITAVTTTCIGSLDGVEQPQEQPKPKKRKRKARKAKPDDMVKKPYGPHGRVKLNDREVEFLDSKFPNWRIWLREADEWLYVKNKTYDDDDYLPFFTRWINNDYNNLSGKDNYNSCGYNQQYQPPQEKQEQQEEERKKLAAAAAEWKKRNKLDWLGGLE